MRGLIAGLTILALIVAIAIVVLGGRRSPEETDLLRIADRLTREPGSQGSDSDPAHLDPLDVAPEAEDDSPAEDRQEEDPQETGTGLRPERAEARPRRDRANLYVLVVDPMGTPVAGVPVELLAGEERFLEEPLHTDEKGELRLQKARNWIGSRSGAYLRHDLPFAQAPKVALDEAGLAGEFVVSKLPPFGSLLVSVVEPDGRASGAGSQAGIGIIADAERNDPSSALKRHIWEHSLEAGHGRIDFVELGREWEVRAWLAGSDILSRVSVDGPRTHGEEVSVIVERGKDHPILSFRAVRQDGTPIRDAKLEVRRHEFIRTVGLERTTDEHGYFRVDVPKENLFGNKEIAVVRRPKKGPKLSGKADYPDPLEPGLNECGNVTLYPDELLVAGQVVDASGAPVEGAKVVAGTNTLDGFAWNDRGSVSEESDAEGKFELYGFLLDSPFELRAGKGEDRSEEQKIEKGSTGVVLLLEKRCNVSGTMRVPDGFDPGAVHFELLRQEDEERQDFRSRNIESTGVFTMSTVPEGVYMLQFQLANEPLQELRNIVVQGDTDVGEVDLRSKLALLRIGLVGGDGTPKGDLAWKKSNDEESEWQGDSFEGREIVLSTLAGPLDLRVNPHGYRQAMLEGVQGFVRVPLEHPLMVRLELETTEPLPKLPYLFDPQLKVGDVKVGTPLGAKYFTEENRSVLFEVGVAGTIEVAWHLEKRGENWAAGGEVLGAHRVQIEVQEMAGTQTFPLRLKAGVLEKLTNKPPF